MVMALCAWPALAQVTVLSAGRIDTMDPARPRAGAMAFDADGRILALGTRDALLREHPGAKHVDVGEATVIPGLIDAHGHMFGLGMSRLTADLVGTGSKDEVIARLREFARELPAGAWLVGRGWDQNDWPEQVFPTAADLDAAFPDRPVWLERIDGHASWANSAALRLLGRRNGNPRPLQDRRFLIMAAVIMAVNAAMGLIGLTPGLPAGVRVAWEAHAFGFVAGALLIGPWARLFRGQPGSFDSSPDLRDPHP